MVSLSVIRMKPVISEIIRQTENVYLPVTTSNIISGSNFTGINSTKLPKQSFPQFSSLLLCHSDGK